MCKKAEAAREYSYLSWALGGCSRRRGPRAHKEAAVREEANRSDKKENKAFRTDSVKRVTLFSVRVTPLKERQRERDSGQQLIHQSTRTIHHHLSDEEVKG